VAQSCARWFRGWTAYPAKRSPEAGLPPLKAAGADAATIESASGDPAIYDGAFANNGWMQELPSR